MAASPLNEAGWPARSSRWIKLGAVAVIAIAAIALYMVFGDALSLDALAAREAQLRESQREHPVLIYGGTFAVYAAVTGLSIPGATPLTLLCGWFFGFWRAVILVSFASTTGATLAFLLARFLLRDLVQHRFGTRLSALNEALKREGAFYLFTLRLIPVVPFFVLNLVMGLTPLKTRTYWWVTQLGMLPATCVYVYAGTSVPDLNTLADQGTRGILTPQLLVAFALLGLFPLIARLVVRAVRGKSAASEDGPAGAED